MNRLFAMIFVIAGLAISFPPPGPLEEEPAERRTATKSRKAALASARRKHAGSLRRNSRQALRASSRSSTT